MNDRMTSLVTGASSGIGLATVRRLADNGHNVLGMARSEERLASNLAPIDASAEGSIEWYVGDVTDQSHLEGVVDSALDRFGRIDVLVNNAGRTGGGMVADVPREVWDDVLAVNLTSAVRLTQEVLRRSGMRDRGWGRVINVASTAGKQGVLYASPYCASKHALVGFSKSAGFELAPTGITVNAVCPGYVETPMAERVRQGHADHFGVPTENIMKKFVGKIPLGRYCEAEEVAGMIGYLTSDSAASITGQAINVCGGLGNY